jgi:hypothetical protein
MASSSTTITIRLSTADADRLDREATKRGLSKSDFARQTILTELEAASDESIRSQFEGMKGEVKSLKTALAESVRALLLTSERLSKEKVAEFIKRTFEE